MKNTWYVSSNDLKSPPDLVATPILKPAFNAWQPAKGYTIVPPIREFRCRSARSSLPTVVCPPVKKFKSRAPQKPGLNRLTK